VHIGRADRSAAHTLADVPLLLCLWGWRWCAAPELHITADGHHVVYFVSDSQATKKLVVGVAVSKSGVAGPYLDVLGAPLVQTRASDCFGAIDPTFFTDPADGTQYVLWKEDGNSCGQPTPIKAAPVAANGTVFVGPHVELIANDPASWEGAITEAPWVVFAAGGYTLFYSGNAYNQPSYAIGVARGTSMTVGPWTKNPKNPILRSAPGAGGSGSPLHFGPGGCSVGIVGGWVGGWVGGCGVCGVRGTLAKCVLTGHCSVVELHTSTGHYGVVYAAEQPGGSGARNLMLDTVGWGPDGWAAMISGGGFPSNTSIPIPN
jgi:hypothetical protein